MYAGDEVKFECCFAASFLVWFYPELVRAGSR